MAGFSDSVDVLDSLILVLTVRVREPYLIG